MEAKNALRKELRARRNSHVASLDPRIRALMFSRPPSPVTSLIADEATVACYLAGPGEAPAAAYARFLHEAGHSVALPWFKDRASPMTFRQWTTPWVEDNLVAGPWSGIKQPAADAPEITPDVVFVPLVGFSSDGARLGQGGGHYDRWLAQHPHTIAIGLAWDCQLVENLPCEAHDRPLRAVITPARIYGPWEAVS